MTGEKRDFVKVPMDIPIRYKFLSKTTEVKDQEVHEGHTANLSGSGLVLVTKIPSGETIASLLAGEVFVGLNILLPSHDEPLKALAKMEWIEAISDVPGKCMIRVRFLDMPKESSDEILRYTIRAQITKKVQRGTP